MPGLPKVASEPAMIYAKGTKQKATAQQAKEPLSTQWENKECHGKPPKGWKKLM